jgi:glutathione S-transferase
MKLYQSVGPNPRVVTMFVAEKGIALDRAYVDVMKAENRQGEHLARNPSGGMPYLELDDGSCLPESTAICEYLEERFPNPPLIGATPEARARTRSVMRLIDQQIVVPMTNAFRSAEALQMFEARTLCVPEAAEGNKAYARDGLAKADALLSGSEWLAGDRFTLADILLFCFTDFGAKVGQPIPDALTRLQDWHGRVSARDSATISANPKHGLKEAA